VTSKKTSEVLEYGEIFRVAQENKGTRDVLWLHLDDGRGWVPDRSEGLGIACVRQRAAALAAVVASRRMQQEATQAQKRRRLSSRVPPIDVQVQENHQHQEQEPDPLPESVASAVPLAPLVEPKAAPGLVTPVPPRGPKATVDPTPVLDRGAAKEAMAAPATTTTTTTDATPVTTKGKGKSRGKGNGKGVGQGECEGKRSMGTASSSGNGGGGGGGGGRESQKGPPKKDNSFEAPAAPEFVSPVSLRSENIAMLQKQADCCGNEPQSSHSRSTPSSGADTMCYELWSTSRPQRGQGISLMPKSGKKDSPPSTRSLADTARPKKCPISLHDEATQAVATPENVGHFASPFKTPKEAQRFLSPGTFGRLEGAELAAAEASASLDSAIWAEVRAAEEAAALAEKDAADKEANLRETEPRLLMASKTSLEDARNRRVNAAREAARRAADLEAAAERQREAWKKKVERTEELLKHVSRLVEREEAVRDSESEKVEKAKRMGDEALATLKSQLSSLKQRTALFENEARDLAARCRATEERTQQCLAAKSRSIRAFEEVRKASSEAKTRADQSIQDTRARHRQVFEDIIPKLKKQERELEAYARAVVDDAEGSAAEADLMVCKTNAEVDELIQQAQEELDLRKQELNSQLETTRAAAIQAQRHEAEVTDIANKLEASVGQALSEVDRRTAEFCQQEETSLQALQQECEQAQQHCEDSMVEQLAELQRQDEEQKNRQEASRHDAEELVLHGREAAAQAERDCETMETQSEEMLLQVETRCLEMQRDAETETQRLIDESETNSEIATMKIVREEQHYNTALRHMQQELAQTIEMAMEAKGEARAAEEQQHERVVAAQAAAQQAGEAWTITKRALEEAARADLHYEEIAVAAEARAQEQQRAASQACCDFVEEAQRCVREAERRATLAVQQSEDASRELQTLRETTAQDLEELKEKRSNDVRRANLKATNAENAVQETMRCARRSQSVLSSYLQQALQTGSSHSPGRAPLLQHARAARSLSATTAAAKAAVPKPPATGGSTATATATTPATTPAAAAGFRSCSQTALVQASPGLPLVTPRREEASGGETWRRHFPSTLLQAQR